MNIYACILFKRNERNDNLPYLPALDNHSSMWRCQEGRPQVRAERDDLDTQEVVKACGLGGGLKRFIFIFIPTWGNNPI